MPDDEATAAQLAAVTELKESVERLSGVVAELSGRVSITEATQRAIDNQRRTSNRLAGSLIFNVLLSIGLIFALIRIDNNAEEINDVQQRTSNRVLCPLYQLLVDQADALPDNAADENHDGTTTDEEQAKMDHTIDVIRDGYSALQCQAPAES